MFEAVYQALVERQATAGLRTILLGVVDVVGSQFDDRAVAGSLFDGAACPLANAEVLPLLGIAMKACVGSLFAQVDVPAANFDKRLTAAVLSAFWEAGRFRTDSFPDSLCHQMVLLKAEFGQYCPNSCSLSGRTSDRRKGS